jgi:hypothetical protein
VVDSPPSPTSCRNAVAEYTEEKIIAFINKELMEVIDDIQHNSR